VIISNIESNFSSRPIEAVIGSSKFCEICKNSITELGASTVLTGTACFFAAGPQVAISLVAFTIGVLAINFFFRVVGVIADVMQFTKISDTCRAIAPFNMAFLYLTTGNILVHEAGHKAAISLVYRQARSRMTIDGFHAGSTTWYIRKFSTCGKLLGPLNARMFVAAAGPLAAVALATIGIIFALQLGNQYSYLRDCGFFASVFSIVGHVNYALSGLSADPEEFAHDFVMLWKGGIHPIASAVFLVAVPAFITISFLYYNNYFNKNSELK